jgi:hypothetical protein
VEKMLKCLAEFDAESADYLESNRELFRSLFEAERFTAFEQQVQGYALLDAHAALEAAAQAHLG